MFVYVYKYIYINQYYLGIPLYNIQVIQHKQNNYMLIEILGHL